MLNLFIDAFPLKTWETVLERKDNKLANPSYYVCFHFDPVVENIYHKFCPLLICFQLQVILYICILQEILKK